MTRGPTMLQAIETVYRGYRFRSRLEARWAVFFDALDIVWQYEQEGYNLDGLWYLPDFWLPDLGYWVEIKPMLPEDRSTELETILVGEEIEKADRLARLSGKDVYLLCGPIETVEKTRQSTIIGFTPSQPLRSGRIYAPDIYLFAQCPLCGRAGITFAGYIPDLKCGCFDQLQQVANPLLYKVLSALYPKNQNLADEDSDLEFWGRRLDRVLCGDDSPSIRRAYLTAQQARFEHGESGARR